MVKKELSNAAVELNCIFDNMQLDLLKKIPKSFREFLLKIESKDYKFEYVENKKLSEQKLLPMTKGIIALIYKDYLCDDYERAEYIKECNKILAKENNGKYDSNDIFNTNLKNTEKLKKVELPIETKKVSFFNKIINKIKSILKRI